MNTFMSERGNSLGLGKVARGACCLFLLAMLSCSPKGYVYKDGTKQGVRYKPAVSPAEQKWITVTALLIAFVAKK